MKKLFVPNQSILKNVEKFCLEENPYLRSVKNDELFVKAMRESIRWHQSRNEIYSKILKSKEYNFSDLKNIEDLKDVPYLIASFFKYHEVKSLADHEISLHLTSSGTSGQKSQMFFDQWTIGVAQRMVDSIFKYHDWIRDEELTNYLLFTYGPKEGSQLGTAYTDNFLCKYAPISKVEYAIKYLGEAKDYHFDALGVIKTLKEYEELKKPVRFFGFPSFLYFTLQQMKEMGERPLHLNPDSLVFLGGGWKGHQDKKIEKQELYSLITEMLGIPDERLRDGFGSVEHCIPYIECINHNFHIPTWSKVIIRDIKTLAPVASGRVGYLNFISPYITSVPANSVLMQDLASLHEAEECSCELGTQFFTIIGRAGSSVSASCALTANELMGNYDK